jgi:hypothetical protein
MTALRPASPIELERRCCMVDRRTRFSPDVPIQTNCAQNTLVVDLFLCVVASPCEARGEGACPLAGPAVQTFLPVYVSRASGLIDAESPVHLRTGVATTRVTEPHVTYLGNSRDRSSGIT